MSGEIQMSPDLNARQLDALRELVNVGAGTAATALSQMLGQEVLLQVPRAQALPLADAIAAAGPSDVPVTGVAIPLEGDLEARVVLLIPHDDAETLCGLLGVEAFTEVGESALREIGNILGASYLTALANMTGLSLELCPPELTNDRLGPLVTSLLAKAAGETGTALILDTSLDLADRPCSVSFLLVPTGRSVHTLLEPLGLGA
jgi:chemotaxis protein CheC